MLDQNIFSKYKTPQDFAREEQEFEMRKRQQQLQEQLNQQSLQTGQLKQQQMQKEIDTGISSNQPAALRLANEYLAAKNSGDVERMNAIQEFAKTQQKGVVYDPNAGGYVTAAGLPSALGELEYGKQSGAQRAKTAYEPQRAGMVEQQKLQQQLAVKPEIAREEALARSATEKETELLELEATLPQLMDTVSQLSALGKRATYTTAGQVRDIAVRELGMEPTEGAVARKEYESLVNNQILPLLRQTFGAAFTEKEGAELRKTLGDVNASPEEKDAVLRSFIQQKVAQIETLRRQTGAEPAAPQELTPTAPPSFPQVRDKLKAAGYSEQQIQQYIKARGVK